MTLKLPGSNKLIESLSKPINQLALQAKSDGNFLLGYTCRLVPEAMLSVPGLIPILLRPTPYNNTPLADTYLSSLTCSYSRCLLETILDFSLDELDGFVFASNCDHLRRVYDNLLHLCEFSFVEMLDLPHKCEAPHINWYAGELKRLAEHIESHFKITMDETSIEQAIDNYNSLQTQLLTLSALRQENPPAISGFDFHCLMQAWFTSPKQDLLDSFNHHEQNKQTPQIKASKPRLLVIGSRLENPQYIATIESLGSWVVADRFCGGAIPGVSTINRKNSEDIFTTLARHSLENNACPRMMDEFSQRLELVSQIIEEYKVDAVILETMKFCDIWGLEAVPLIKNLKRMNLPVLKLEREYSLLSAGQLETRIQAFLESI